MNKILIVLTLLATTTLFAQVPRSQHVWVIGEENHSYEPVTTSMPYLMSLAQQYGLATQYYADMHNSISALMHVTAGATVTTNDYTTATFDVPNIVRALNQKGLSFRSYQEDLAYAGFLGMYSGKYAKRHNPLAYFSDVAYTGLKYNNVPFTQLAADLSNGHTGNFNYITPNVDNDAHDGTMQTADEWLRARVPAILNQPAFRPGGDGLLVIFFDEGDLGSSIDFRCSATTYNKVGAGCGGRVAVVLVGPNVKRGFRSSVWYNHETLLKTICLALGTSSCPGGAATAKPMADFFITPLAASPASARVASGQAAQYSLTLQPVSAFFNQTVSLSCSGLPAGTACGFSPSEVHTGNGPATVALTVTTATSAASAERRSKLPYQLAIWLGLPGMAVLANCGLERNRRKLLWTVAGAALILVLALVCAGCGGAAAHSDRMVTPAPATGTSGGTGSTGSTTATAGTYNITVTATTGSEQFSVPVTLAIE